MIDVRTTSVEEAPGIGPKRADALEEAYGVRTLEDLLQFYPRKYADRSKTVPMRELDPSSDEEQQVVAEVVNISKARSKDGNTRLEVDLKDEHGGFGQAVWFHGLGVRYALDRGQTYIFVGTVNYYGRSISITHPDFFEAGGTTDSIHVGRIIPYYPGSQVMSDAGLSNKVMRQVMWDVLEALPVGAFPSPVPEEVAADDNLYAIYNAYNAVHFPRSQDEIDRARARLKYDELYLIQLLMTRIRASRGNAPAFQPRQDGLSTQFIRGLPFNLTGAQEDAVEDVQRDTESGRQMNRLIQGDVGSGKTVVGVSAMLHALDNGYQAAFMAPTEILAEQHHENLRAYMEPLGIEPALLTGSMTANEQEAVRERLRSGDCRVAVGTHALITENSGFDDLGLAVIDEQHRFGVQQRRTLFEKGRNTHMLLMTATPIPRSLAMTVYGDLDVTVMDEMPAGRKPVDTYWNIDEEREDVYKFLQDTVDANEQIYVVCPLVEETDGEDLRDAESHAHHLRQHLDASVGLIHGQMDQEDKERAMQAFASGQTDVLVATTVIEVGVDVENATCIVIEHANQFGLSQLHQLRGRVGRSDQQSYCVLMTEDEELTDNARQRMFAMVDHDDGFRISEIDLRLRGTGDFLGTKQSGLPDLKIADPATDDALLELAREAATKTVEADASLKTWPMTRAHFQRAFTREDTELAAIG